LNVSGGAQRMLKIIQRIGVSPEQISDLSTRITARNADAAAASLYHNSPALFTHHWDISPGAGNVLSLHKPVNAVQIVERVEAHRCADLNRQGQRRGVQGLIGTATVHSAAF
jgi:hypothetical protein